MNNIVVAIKSRFMSCCKKCAIVNSAGFSVFVKNGSSSGMMNKKMLIMMPIENKKIMAGWVAAFLIFCLTACFWVRYCAISSRDFFRFPAFSPDFII